MKFGTLRVLVNNLNKLLCPKAKNHSIRRAVIGTVIIFFDILFRVLLKKFTVAYWKSEQKLMINTF